METLWINGPVNDCTATKLTMAKVEVVMELVQISSKVHDTNGPVKPTYTHVEWYIWSGTITCSTLSTALTTPAGPAGLARMAGIVTRVMDGMLGRGAEGWGWSWTGKEVATISPVKQISKCLESHNPQKELSDAYFCTLSQAIVVFTFSNLQCCSSSIWHRYHTPNYAIIFATARTTDRMRISEGKHNELSTALPFDTWSDTWITHPAWWLTE